MSEPHTDLLHRVVESDRNPRTQYNELLSGCTRSTVEFPGSGATLCLIHVVYSGAGRSLRIFLQREFHLVTSVLVEVIFGLKVVVWGFVFASSADDIYENVRIS
jgi:hypothetical protein